ncbi:NUDIX hydrolase [Nevskia sp.]|uniref:NUDIX hydrolase n=1 Tax=Nevskia sp. TaxID=1929292 RepID=UPI003F71682D
MPEILHEGRFLRLYRSGTWEYVARANARGAAFIAARTDEGELLLVEQFRVPLDAPCIELPAGIVGDEAAYAEEDFEAAALRELEEETGYRAGRIRHLLTGPTAPGMSSELLHFYVATKLTRVHDGGGVEGENITVHRVPITTIQPWLMAQMAAGKRVDPRVFVGLWFLAQAPTD